MIRCTVRHHLVAILAVTGGLVLATPAGAADATKGAEQQCIRAADIDHTTVIDGQTILVTMRRNQFKRIDLLSRCHGLAFEEGFAYSMQNYELCKSTPLRVINSGGVCAIDKIISIDQAEAKALLAKK